MLKYSRWESTIPTALGTVFERIQRDWKFRREARFTEMKSKVYHFNMLSRVGIFS